MKESVQNLIHQVEKAKALWEKTKSSSDFSPSAYQEKLRAHWTYHSNAIEGNTLTLGETIFFLREGLTAEGKPLKDFLEAKNHAEAIDEVQSLIVDGNRSLSESLIKELHAIILKGITHTVAKNDQGETIQKPCSPGQYKTQPNHVLTLSGQIHRYVEPVDVPRQMNEMISQYEKSVAAGVNSVITAADVHYDFVRIHPFDDGNGRLARLVMNFILMKAGFVPVVIFFEKRREYLQALEKADQGDRDTFYAFILQSLLDTYELMSGDE
jgi:Fic family protein